MFMVIIAILMAREQRDCLPPMPWQKKQEEMNWQTIFYDIAKWLPNLFCLHTTANNQHLCTSIPINLSVRLGSSLHDNGCGLIRSSIQHVSLLGCILNCDEDNDRFSDR